MNKKALDLLGSLQEHDSVTYFHSLRVGVYAFKLAVLLRSSQDICRQAYTAGVYHDIGKLNVPREILSKPTKLTDEEFRVIRRHPDWGSEIGEELGLESDIVRAIVEHHENINGSGYPNKLFGSTVSVLSKIIRIVDSWDAMTKRRSYKEEIELSVAKSELIQCKGSLYSEKGVDTFLLML